MIINNETAAAQSGGAKLVSLFLSPLICHLRARPHRLGQWPAGLLHLVLLWRRLLLMLLLLRRRRLLLDPPALGKLMCPVVAALWHLRARHHRLGQ